MSARLEGAGQPGKPLCSCSPWKSPVTSTKACCVSECASVCVHMYESVCTYVSVYTSISMYMCVCIHEHIGFHIPPGRVCHPGMDI
jgi:hypothetical protein